VSETGWARAISDPALEDLGLSGDLVTGEAVVLELRPASFATRALSFSIDLVVQLAVGIGLTVVVATVAPDADAAAVSAIVLGIWVATLVGWPVTVETVTRGRSLGKLAFGLRVVRDDGGPVRFRQALTRGLLAVVEIYLTFGSIALIASLSNPRGKRVGDILAGTYVIRERTAARSISPVSMPPELAGWARGADLGRIPDRLAMAVRQFLGRAGALHPSSRQRLGIALAEQIGRYIAPPPPAGTHPETFLAAVLAERRRRDEVRLMGEARARLERDWRRRGASPLSATGTRLIGEDEDGLSP
jgi:uncharacterized RDD family membrane protein YckC